MVIVFISPNLAIVLGYSTDLFRQAGVLFETPMLAGRMQIQEQHKSKKGGFSAALECKNR
jgi:hypothetical protein